MKLKTSLLSVLAAALLLFGIESRAQHSGHHPEGQKQESKSPMEEMMAQHQQVQMLADQMVESFKEIRGEKAPEKLAAKLAGHGALLERFSAAMKKQSAAMAEHMKSCPMMGADHKHGEK